MQGNCCTDILRACPVQERSSTPTHQQLQEKKSKIKSRTLAKLFSFFVRHKIKLMYIQNTE